MPPDSPSGLMVVLGSGETAPGAQKIYDWLFQRLPPAPQVCVLETPAGFELNSDKVAGRVADYLAYRLQNYRPQVTVVPARRQNSLFSPDDPLIVAPLRQADVIFMGPGSPTYAVRQLRGSLAWDLLAARHRQGCALIFASAATLAVSAHTLPVYEIYKVGQDLHWQAGLDILGLYGLAVVFIPHWDNTDGGTELDTSRCFMGRRRFEQLMALLPPAQTLVGIDEHTALILDPARHECRVMGKSGVTLISAAGETRFQSGDLFGLDRLGVFEPPAPQTIASAAVWEMSSFARSQQEAEPALPAEVSALVEARQVARAGKDWAAADRLREQLARLGWVVQDTPAGPAVSRQSQG